MALRLATCAALVGTAAGTINLAITDCGDSSTHGHVTGISPSSIQQGKAAVVRGAGHLDTTVADGSFDITVKAAGVTVTSCKGDICSPSKCNLPAGTGSVNYHGVACPLAAGDVSLDFDVSVSRFVPSALAHLDIEMAAEGSAGKILCAKLSTTPGALAEPQPSPALDDSLLQCIKHLADTFPAAQVSADIKSKNPFKIAEALEILREELKEAPQELQDCLHQDNEPDSANGGMITLDWSDCGDSSTAGHITDVTPSQLTLGEKTSIVGKGSMDEDVSGATYKVTAKAFGFTVFSHEGDACSAETITLPAGVGTIDMHGFNCPISQGNVELDLDVQLSSAIPASMARTTIQLEATTSSGKKALCVKINTRAARAATGEQVAV